MAIKGIIFDLDGTLVDTLDDLTKAMNFGLSEFELPQRSRNECCEMIGNGLRKFAQRALGSEKEHLVEDLRACVLAYYNDNCLLETVPYEGIPEVVETVVNRGIQVAVLTNKHQEPAEIITRHFFDNLFDPIIGQADGIKAKPDPATTHQILNEWQLPAEQVLFVGDSEPDVLTARAVGIKCLACEWGFRSREQLQSAGAENFIQYPSQIVEFLF